MDMKNGLLLCLVIISFSGLGFAATNQYRINAASVPVFMQASTDSTQLRQLGINTVVTVEDSDKQSGFALIKTDNGNEGWVAAQYLAPVLATDSQPKTGLTNEVKTPKTKDITTLQQQNSALQNQLNLVKAQAQKFALLSTHNDLVTGAGILIFGFLLGWWAGRRQRRRNWDNRNRFS